MSQFNTENNDPFGTHKAQVARGQEMTNLAQDPFMTTNLSGGARRPTIRVAILKATGLPQPRSNNVVVQCKVQAQYTTPKRNSMLATNECADPVNPTWRMSGNRMTNWVKGDSLIFHIMGKDRSGYIPGMNSDVIVAKAELPFDQYFPWGFGKQGLGNDWLPLFSENGRPIEGAYLYILVEVDGVGEIGMGAKLQRMCCGALNPRQLKDMIVHLPETIVKEAREILGEPADDRNKSDMGLLIAIPFLLFLFLTWMAFLLHHFCSIAMAFLIGLAACVCLGLILVSVTVQKKNKKPLFAIGCLALLAVVLGVYAGHSGWNSSWQQWWWMQTGRKLGATAGTPAAARSDPAVISFATVKNGTAWTSVDATRAAGYRHGDIYCAAPILDPKVALGDIMRVEFWAIGINCCDDFGSFTCDQSREFLGGGTGVVMKDHGMPCNGCHKDKFRLAAAKAAGVNRMVSAPGALFVRYVSTAKTIDNLYLGKCVFSLIWSLVLGMLIFGTLGFVVNYKGWGKPGRFPLYNMLDEPHKKTARMPFASTVPPEMTQAQAKQPIVEPGEKEWNLILTHGPQGELTMAATNPQDNVQTQYGAF